MTDGGDRNPGFDSGTLDELLEDEDLYWDRDDPEPVFETRPPAAPPSAQQPQVRYRVTKRGWTVLAIVPLLLVVGAWLLFSSGQALAVEGLDDGAVLGADRADGFEFTVRFEKAVDAELISASLGDEPLPVEVSEDGLSATVTATDVPEGEHEIRVEVGATLPTSRGSVVRAFTVDRTAPTMTLLGPTEAARVTEPVTVQLEVDDPDATVAMNGEPVVVNGGVAQAEFSRPPAAPVEVTLTDPAGNVTTESVHVPLALAGEPGQPPIRGVHASGWTWTTEELRGPIMQMVEDGLINTVQLDLKDEGGDVWYDTRVELAHEIGAVTELWDLAAVVEELHAMDVRVVGRIVNFRDPRLAAYAVESGNMDWIVQNPDGSAYGKYGGFANPYNEEVWEYNIALAEEAAELGVDDIMYDYVRRPDDYIENMLFPGQDRAPEDAIVDFLDVSQQRIHAAGARLSAAVFGIAATRPDEVAQDIPRIGEVVDYVAPMTYPSHWGPGEYGVADPNSQPYDIVYRSMEDFGSQLAGTGAGIVIWIQDFSLGVDYGPAEVRAQIEAAADAGVDSFLLWDAATTYTAAALE